jgi:hypothetical protein
MGLFYTQEDSQAAGWEPLPLDPLSKEQIEYFESGQSFLRTDRLGLFYTKEDSQAAGWEPLPLDPLSKEQIEYFESGHLALRTEMHDANAKLGLFYTKEDSEAAGWEPLPFDPLSKEQMEYFESGQSFLRTDRLCADPDKKPNVLVVTIGKVKDVADFNLRVRCVQKDAAWTNVLADVGIEGCVRIPFSSTWRAGIYKTKGGLQLKLELWTQLSTLRKCLGTVICNAMEPFAECLCGLLNVSTHLVYDENFVWVHSAPIGATGWSYTKEESEHVSFQLHDPSHSPWPSLSSEDLKYYDSVAREEWPKKAGTLAAPPNDDRTVYNFCGSTAQIDDGRNATVKSKAQTARSLMKQNRNYARRRNNQCHFPWCSEHNRARKKDVSQKKLRVSSKRCVLKGSEIFFKSSSRSLALQMQRHFGNARD